MIIINCEEFPTIQAFLNHALLQQQETLDTKDQEKIQALKDQHESNEILQEFKHSQKCHDFYHPCSGKINKRKPTRSKPIITTKDQVFYYYLTSKQRLATRYYSRPKARQKAIKKAFTKAAPTSSAQAISILTILIS